MRDAGYKRQCFSETASGYKRQCYSKTASSALWYSRVCTSVWFLL